jgi:hypothetical protein
MMMYRVVLMGLLLLAADGVHAITAKDGAGRALQADAHARKISDAEKFVEEVDQTLQLARNGEYGSIKAKDLRRLDIARDTIVDLLEGHDNGSDLAPEERLRLFNAQEEITSIIRNDQKDRRICRSVATTSSRLGQRECLTIAEREARAKLAREQAKSAQGSDCVVSATNRC